MRAKVLVVPVYQKHWLYHVWTEAAAADAAAEGPAHWTKGTSIQEKATLFGKELSHKVNAAAAKQWSSIQVAEDGTFKNRLYRLAQWVLSREDPRETFLKSLPREASSLEIIFPCTLKERLVRRRLRRMALAQEHFHNRRILGWALATLPQLPLVITPFPNVTLYYTAYKMVSHYRALQGCRTLRSAFERYDKEEAWRRHHRERSLSGQGTGILGGLAAILPLPCRRASGGGDGRGHGSSKCSGQSNGIGCTSDSQSMWSSTSAHPAPLPCFRCCKTLDEVVRPLDRWHTPLTDEAAARLEQRFHPGPGAAAHSAAKRKAGDRDVDRQVLYTGAGQLPELVARLRAQVLQQWKTQDAQKRKHVTAAQT